MGSKGEGSHDEATREKHGEGGRATETESSDKLILDIAVINCLESDVDVCLYKKYASDIACPWPAPRQWHNGAGGHHGEGWIGRRTVLRDSFPDGLLEG